MEISQSKLKIVATTIAVVILVASIAVVCLVVQNQSAPLTQLGSDIDASVNTCLNQIRKTIDNKYVFLEKIDINTNALVNKYDGFQICVPHNWKLDNANFQYVTNLYNEHFKLSIFKQDIDLSYDTAQRYIDYSNFNIRHNYGTMVLIEEATKSLGQYFAQTISWKRDRISTVNVDLNYYYKSDIILNNKTVMTFLLKTSQSMIENYRQIVDEAISEMSLINQTNYRKPVEITKEIPDITMSGKTLRFEVPNDKCVFGIYHASHKNYMQELTALEKAVNHKFELIMEYYTFKDTFDEAKERITTLYGDQRVMLVTLQPYVSSVAKDSDGSCLIPRIANGEYDDFLFNWAYGLKEFGEPVFLRFGNEMNGDWAEWCSWFYSLDPDLYIMAWSRIYTLFEKVDADNVYFVWNPHDRTYPTNDWNKEYLYYPGDSKVDWIGLTAYNNGETRLNEEWRELEECYSQLYYEYMSRYSSKPFIITEFACNEIGGNKSKWITEGFPLFREKYPNIRIVVWWNGIDNTWIYYIDFSEQSREAFREAIRNPYFQLNAVDQT